MFLWKHWAFRGIDKTMLHQIPQPNEDETKGKQEYDCEYCEITLKAV